MERAEVWEFAHQVLKTRRMTRANLPRVEGVRASNWFGEGIMASKLLKSANYGV